MVFDCQRLVSEIGPTNNRVDIKKYVPVVTLVWFVLHTYIIRVREDDAPGGPWSVTHTGGGRRGSPYLLIVTSSSFHSHQKTISVIGRETLVPNAINLRSRSHTLPPSCDWYDTEVVNRSASTFDPCHPTSIRPPGDLIMNLYICWF